MIPPKKPKNFSKILDILNTQAAAKQFSPKTYVNLVGEYSRKAYDNGELSKKEYMDIVQPLFGDAGIMATEKIKQYDQELQKYADGGRIGFLKGGDTKYNAMVFKMYAEAGGQEGTGMDIDSFAEKYFPKFATGGRVNYRGGDAARSDAASGRNAGRASPSGGADDRGSNAQNLNQQGIVAAANIRNAQPEKSPFRSFLDHSLFTKGLKRVRSIPNYHQLGGFDFMSRFPNTPPSVAKALGYGYQGLTEFGKSLTDPDYDLEEAYDKAKEEGRLNALGVDAYGNPTNPITQQYYNLPSELQPNFSTGGRVNYNSGSMEPDTMALKEKIEEIMDIEGVGFGEAFKQAMRELASQSKEND
jgi:hypothetical protein